jgi:hypothetical protein
MTMRPKNEKEALSDTRSMLRLRALRLRRAANSVSSQRLLKVKQQILQRIIERLS